MDERLLRRLVGAAAVFAVVFALTLLLPAPGEIQPKSDKASITLDLSAAPLGDSPADPAPPTPPPAQPIDSSTTAEAERPEPEARAEATPSSPPGRKQTPAPKPEAEPEVPQNAPARTAKVDPPSEMRQPPAPQRQPAPSGPASDPAANAPPPPTDDGGSWWVQVAALSDWERSHSLLNKLEAAGFRSAIESIESGGKSIYRVRVGRYAQREDAVAAQRALAGEGYGGTTVVSSD